MVGLDSLEIGTAPLHLWVAAGAATALIVLQGLSLFSSRLRAAARTVLPAGFIISGAAFGSAVTWGLLDHNAAHERAAERRALELRAGQLAAQALAPGSPLACLDDSAGENIAAVCEKALFASPAVVATAASYVAAKFSLLSGMVSYGKHGGKDIDYLLVPLRRSLEADRFGFLAYVLAVRDGCTGASCKALAVLGDAGRVFAKLDEQALDRHLQHYRELWAKAAEATSSESVPAGAQSGGPQGPRKLVNIDFPAAASIPPISIMNPEPAGPVLPGVAAAAAANPTPPHNPTSASRHSRKQPANAAAQTVVGRRTPAGAVEPIWPEPIPPPPLQAPGAGAQVASPSPAAGSGPARTQ